MPAPVVDASALLAAVDAAGLDWERRSSVARGELFAEGWEPPPLTARAAVSAVAQPCADIAALEPLDEDGAAAVLARAWPMAGALRALVALRVDSYDALSGDTAAYHLDSLADVAWWAGELLEQVQQAEQAGEAAAAWKAASTASSWAGSLAGQRFALGLRREVGHTADALTAYTGDAGFRPELAALADAVLCAHGVRAPRGWGRWTSRRSGSSRSPGCASGSSPRSRSPAATPEPGRASRHRASRVIHESARSRRRLILQAVS